MSSMSEETKIQVSMSDANTNPLTFTISNINEAKIPVGVQDGVDEDAESDTTQLLTALDTYMRGLTGLLNVTYGDTTITYRASLNYLLDSR